MDNLDADSPRLARELPATSAAVKAAFLTASGLALVLIVYVGSYAFLVANGIHGWEFVPPMEDRTIWLLQLLYYPLDELLRVVHEILR